MSQETNTTYGFNPHMPLWGALWVWFLHKVKRETWRGIGYDYFPWDKNNTDEELRGNQFYGMDVIEAASRRLKTRSRLPNAT